MKWKSLLPWALVGVLAGIVVLMLCRKPVVPHVGPVTPTTPAESVLVEHWTHDTLVRIVKDRDSLKALERRVNGLTDEVESWSSIAASVSQQLAEVDSAWAARFDSMAGMLAVQYRRGRIDVVQYRDGIVSTSAVRTWRNTWTLKAKPGGGLTLVQRKLPVDFGLFAAGGFSTRPDTWTPAPWAWAGLSATRQGVTAQIGPMFDGVLKLRGEVRADWRF